MSILSKALRRINLKAIGAAIVSVGGLLSHPEVMNVLPEKYALGVSILGVIAQSVTSPIKKPKWKDDEANQ